MVWTFFILISGPKYGEYHNHGTTSFIGLHSRKELQLSEKQKRLYSVEHASDLYPEYYLIELGNFDDVARNTLDEWIYFLKNEEIQTGFSAKGLSEAKETLDVLKMSASERRAYEHYQVQLHDKASMYESAYVVSRAEGYDEANRHTVLRSYKKGLAVETIADITGLSVAAVQKILREAGIE